jgi:hypothetical protein
MTNALRKTFNDMSDVLNEAIKAAVAGFEKFGVVYVEWNDVLDGHRFCEEGVDEPDPDHEDTWFLNYAPVFDTKDRPWLDELAKFLDGSVSGYAGFKLKYDPYFGPTVGIGTTGAKVAGVNKEAEVAKVTNNTSTPAIDPVDALYEAGLGLQDGGIQAPDAIISQQTFVDVVKVFHPKPVLHTKIMDKILEAYLKDPLQCRGVKGTLAVNTDKALSAADEFCKRTDPPSFKPQNANPGTSDDMIISLRNTLDEKKTVSNHEECVAGFKNILDNCDGNNPANVSVLPQVV